MIPLEEGEECPPVDRGVGLAGNGQGQGQQNRGHGRHLPNDALSRKPRCYTDADKESGQGANSSGTKAPRTTASIWTSRSLGLRGELGRVHGAVVLSPSIALEHTVDECTGSRVAISIRIAVDVVRIIHIEVSRPASSLVAGLLGAGDARLIDLGTGGEGHSRRSGIDRRAGTQ